MRHLGPIAIVGAGLVALIIIAGFFAEASSPAPAPQPLARMAATTLVADPAPPPAEEAKDRYADTRLLKGGAFAPAPARGLLNLTNAPGYRRAGDLSLRVQDCTKAEDDLESKLQTIHGEIVEMLMEGTAGSRTCTLSVVIPADSFRGFITDLRKMGTIQTERITASKLKPGQAEPGSPDGTPDPRELSLVSVRMADEKVALSVLESRGVLASSFDRSSSHFMKGMAVLVEAFGFVLPFVLVFLGVVAPWLVLQRVRRRKAAVAVR